MHAFHTLLFHKSANRNDVVHYKPYFSQLHRLLAIELVVVCDADAAREIMLQKVMPARMVLIVLGSGVHRQTAGSRAWQAFRIACWNDCLQFLDFLPLPKALVQPSSYINARTRVSQPKPSLCMQGYPKSYTYDSLHPFIGQKSMVCSEGKVWSKQRRAFAPGFQFSVSAHQG